MRPANRTDAIMRTFEHLWRKYPDMRLMQLISNITGPGDHFYMEDDEFFEKLVKFQHSVAGPNEVGKKTPE